MTEVDKRKRNDSLISFKIDFTEEQKEARKICHENVVTILTGKPGTAKTTIAASIALELLIRKPKYTSDDPKMTEKYDKIIISRPTVEIGKSIGFLPGSITDKLEPYTYPVINIMEKIFGTENINRLIEKGKIITMPIQFMRGITVENSIVILDEGQNATFEDFKAISSRLGKDSKLLVTSDWRQIDLHKKSRSVSNLFDTLLDLNDIEMIELTENFRHPLAIQIMDRINELEEHYLPF